MPSAQAMSEFRVQSSTTAKPTEEIVATSEMYCGSPVKCTNCDKAFSENGDYREHIKTCLGQVVTEPTVTEQPHTPPPEAPNQKSSVPNENLLTCSICQQTTDNITGLKTHIETKHSEKELAKTISCPQCRFVTENEQTMQNHMKTFHALKCTECQKIFMDNNRLQTHIRETHSRPRANAWIKSSTDGS